MLVLPWFCISNIIVFLGLLTINQLFDISLFVVYPLSLFSLVSSLFPPLVDLRYTSVGLVLYNDAWCMHLLFLCIRIEASPWASWVWCIWATSWSRIQCGLFVIEGVEILTWWCRPAFVQNTVIFGFHRVHKVCLPAALLCFVLFIASYWFGTLILYTAISLSCVLIWDRRDITWRHYDRYGFFLSDGLGCRLLVYSRGLLRLHSKLIALSGWDKMFRRRRFL